MDLLRSVQEELKKEPKKPLSFGEKSFRALWITLLTIIGSSLILGVYLLYRHIDQGAGRYPEGTMHVFLMDAGDPGARHSGSVPFSGHPESIRIVQKSPTVLVVLRTGNQEYALEIEHDMKNKDGGIQFIFAHKNMDALRQATAVAVYRTEEGKEPKILHHTGSLMKEDIHFIDWRFAGKGEDARSYISFNWTSGNASGSSMGSDYADINEFVFSETDFWKKNKEGGE